MELSELTPELFEKVEFTERRRGWDCDEVDRFLEESGTALAQLLVKYRQLEERAAHAESRLAAAEARAVAAEEALAKGAAAPVQAPAPAPAPARPVGGLSEQEEVQQATSTLLMAKRTADATIGEARAEASGIVGEARAQAERIVSEARTEADNELAEGTVRLREAVTSLERRRDAVSSVVSAFESRIEEYRRQVTEVAESLASMAADPEALAERPHMVIPEAATGHTEALVGASAAEAFTPLDQPTEAYDVAEEASWGAGSWSTVVEASATPAESAAPAAPAEAASVEAEELISLSELEPGTGQTNDRFLRELDEAVNERRGDGDDAMSAFFEPTEEPGRRFGWRR